MILIENFSQVIAQIESERGIEKHIVLDAIEKALISAARKKYGAELNVKAYINEDSGEARLWMEKTVVKTKEDELNELTLKEAKELSDDVDIDDTLEIDLDIEEFGRIAAQAAKTESTRISLNFTNCLITRTNTSEVASSLHCCKVIPLFSKMSETRSWP